MFWLKIRTQSYVSRHWIDRKNKWIGHQLGNLIRLASKNSPKVVLCACFRRRFICNGACIAAHQSFHREVHYNSQGVMSPVRRWHSWLYQYKEIFLIFPMFLRWQFANLITVDTCADIFMSRSKTAPRLPTGSLRTGTITPFKVILEIDFCPHIVENPWQESQSCLHSISVYFETSMYICRWGSFPTLLPLCRLHADW